MYNQLAWSQGPQCLAQASLLLRQAAVLSSCSTSTALPSLSLSSPGDHGHQPSSRPFSSLSSYRKDASINSVELANELAALTKTSGTSAKFVLRQKPKIIAPKISPQVDGLKSRFFLASRSGREKEAVDLFLAVMREGMAGVDKEKDGLMPWEYRPDEELMQGFFAAIRTIYQPSPQEEHMVRQGPVLAQLQSKAAQLASQVEEGMAVMKASGIKTLPSVRMMLLRGYITSRNVDKAAKLYHALVAEGEVNVLPSTSFAVANLLIADRKLQEAWSIIDHTLSDRAENRDTRDSDKAAKTPAQRRGAITDAYRNATTSRLLRGVVSSHNWTLLEEIKSRLGALNVPVDPDISTSIIVMAAREDDLKQVQSALKDLKADLLGQTSNGEHDTSASQVSEGAMLEVLNAAVRAYDPKLSPAVVQMVLSLLPQKSTVQEEGTSEEGTASNTQCLALSPATHHALIHSYVCGKDWGAAMNALHDLELCIASPSSTLEMDTIALTLSPYHGLRYFAEALPDEGTVAFAYDQLTQRQARGQVITRPMMNVILRGLARTGPGAVDSTGRLFEEYSSVGLTPDVDSFNAVIEACSLAGKAPAVEALVKYMQSTGVAPDSVTYDLLMRAHMEAGDMDGFLATLPVLQEAKVLPMLNTVREAMDVANREGNSLAWKQLNDMVKERLGRHPRDADGNSGKEGSRSS